MAAIYSNGGNRWNILGFNFTKRDALSSVYKISMVPQLPPRSSRSFSEFFAIAYTKTALEIQSFRMKKIRL
jgi:hypothetical protein